MGTGIFGIGTSGLAAAQAGLLTTGHNISNAGTAGFHRQEIVQRAALPQMTGAGFIGNGVEISTVRRMYDQFLASQVVQAQTQSSRLDAYYSQVKQLDDMLGDVSAGLAPALQQFFAATHDVAANPASVPSRQAMLSASSALVSGLHALNQRYDEIRSGVNTGIAASVSHINSFAEQIASLNRQIVTAQSASQGQPVNDLLDQRDELVLQLNKEVGATVVRQSDGNYNVFIGNGQALVVGGAALKLTSGPVPGDPGRIGVAYSAGGNSSWIPDGNLQGGVLSGYLDFRSQVLDSAQNALGRIAIGLAQSFNDQHKLGQDLNGDLGEAYFALPTATVLGDSGNDPASQITVALTAGTLTTSDYRLTYAGGVYTLTRLADGRTATSSTAPSATSPLTLDNPPSVRDGVSVTAATMNAGESFVIQPTRNAADQIDVLVRDTAKIAAAAPIRTAAAGTNTGNATISAGAVNLGADANLRDNVRIELVSATQYRIVDAATSAVLVAPTAYTSGNDITCNGWTVRISGTPAAGDVFTIGPNSGGTADNRNALALANLGSANTLINGTASYNSAYAQLVSDVGNKTRELEVTSQAQASLLDQSTKSQDALSGVNLDEEAANLLRYQQAYQASGKVLQIATKLFDTVLAIGG
jgi:flagellar hook-associated protein 1 FlgK